MKHSTSDSPSDSSAVRSLHKKALYLSIFTVAYNFLEGIVSIAAGAAAGSIALIGFGLDSFVESLSGGIMIWRFGGRGELSKEEEERRVSRALMLVGYTFFVLGWYVAYECLKKLISREPSEPSLIGIIIAVVSLIVMPVVFYMKYKLGKSVGSRGLVADSKQTLACSYLSLSLLVGLGLNYLYGIWWADPAAGLVIVAFLFKEGLEAVRGEHDGCC